MKFAARDTEAAAPFSVVQVADYSLNYSGNFIASLRITDAVYRKRCSKAVWVFPEEARGRRWLDEFPFADRGEVYRARDPRFEREIAIRTLEAGLAMAALRMALMERQPEPGLVHHSERGVQHASQDYTRC